MTSRIRAGLGGVVLALVAGLFAVTPASAQVDGDGLRVVADAVYRVFPEDGAVEVEIDYTVTNQVPERREGFQIIQTFFTSIADFYPKAAIDLRAVRDNGSALTMTRRALSAEDEAAFADSPFAFWDVDLGPNLFSQQTRRFTVSYRLPDGEARSPDAWARVNPAYASFPVVGRGDSGLGSVRVEFPPGYRVETFGADMTRTDPFGATVLTADAIPVPVEFFALMVGSSEFGLSSRPIEVDGVEGELVISSWPGDEEWDAFVERGLVEGIPFLIDVIGVDWPVEGELEVIETIAPALAGYGGWFYEPQGSGGDDAAIDVGEQLLMDLLGHEIAHAWFNDGFSRMRWLVEGLAEHFGIAMARALGDPVEEFEPVTITSEGAIDLLDWRDPVFNADEPDPTEAFGYAASYQVVSAIVDEIGDDALEDMLVALFAGDNPYRPGLDDPGLAAVDWRDLLDAVELIGGSEEAEDLLTRWVLGDGEEALLPARDAAQEAVDGLEALEPAWDVPDLIPTLLAGWDFDDVETAVAEMADILGDARALGDDAAARSVVLPAGPRVAYEAVDSMSDGFDAVRDGLAAQRSALDRVLAAYDRAGSPTGFFENVGLYGTDVDALVEEAHAAFEAADYDGAIAASAEVDRLRDDAESRGQQRVAIAVGVVFVLLLLVLLVVLFLRRRKRRPIAGEPADEVTAEPDVAED